MKINVLCIPVITLLSLLVSSTAIACPSDHEWAIGLVSGADVKFINPGDSFDLGKAGSKCSVSQVEKSEESETLKAIQKINLSCQLEGGASISGSAVYSVEKNGQAHHFPLMLDLTAGKDISTRSISVACTAK